MLGKNQYKPITNEEIIRRFNEVHKGKYIYDKVEYYSMNREVDIICPKHGIFKQTPHNHLKGQGCPICAKEKRLEKERDRGLKNLIEEGNKRFNNKFDYSKVIYFNNKTNINIICPKHGDIWMTPYEHLHSQFGCKQCALDNIAKDKINKHKLIFEHKASTIHNNKYKYYIDDYNGIDSKMRIICPIHGEFIQTIHDHLQGCGCPKCGVKLSKAEDEIAEVINNIGIFDIIQRNRSVLKPYELDIYSPSKKIAIEYNGLVWHSEKFKENAKIYHIDKTNECKKKGIRLIHIFEDEWLEKPQIVKSMLRNILGKTSNRLYARQCEIRDVDTRTAMQFLDDNHIQGRCKAKYHYGLYHDGELVSLMTFGKTRQQRKYNEDYDNTWELLRFCNKLDTSVVGGASKLLKHFIGEVKPHRIMTYADKRWSVGKLYERLGFTYTHDSKPNYFYVVGQHRENRFKYRKGELVKQGFDPDKSEHEIMLERGIPRIYDCGTMAFEMIL